jgi:hypothetical protein
VAMGRRSVSRGHGDLGGVWELWAGQRTFSSRGLLRVKSSQVTSPGKARRVKSSPAHIVEGPVEGQVKSSQIKSSPSQVKSSPAHIVERLVEGGEGGLEERAVVVRAVWVIGGGARRVGAEGEGGGPHVERKREGPATWHHQRCQPRAVSSGTSLAHLLAHLSPSLLTSLLTFGSS